jgi:hydroxymethylpyrimidine/phosphomethylpyrimidine kinase
MTPTPIALTIAGSDSSGGAGIQADLKTFTALGVYGASVLTALTAQNTRGVTAVHAPPAEFVTAQIDTVLDDLEVGAVKTGMLANAAIVLAVADAMDKRPSLPLVIDPVMVATSGDRLLEPEAVAAYKTRLIPRALLITPNLPEAAALLDEAPAADLEAAERQARALLALGSRAVLVKGGHRATGSEAVDVLALADGTVHHVSAPWVDTRNTHGTGCTLSAAITAGLATGLPLVEAVRAGKRYLSEALASGRDLPIGKGHGPVDHLYLIRSRGRAL